MGPRLWRLGTYHLAVFLVRGDHESLLFEVGISSTAPLVLAQLAGLGVDPAEIRYVMLSHAHSDHATGGACLAGFLPRAQLVMSQASLRHLAKPETAQLFREEDAFTTAAIRQKQTAAQLTENAGAPLLSEAITLREPGQSLKINGVQLELLGAEGHVPGGLVGWLPAEGALLASDSAGFCSQGQPAYPLYFVSYGDYQANLAKFCALQPETLGLGHQDSFRGGSAREFLERAAGKQAEEHQRLVRGLAAGQGEEDLAQEVFHRYYHHELAIYPPDGMMSCCRLLVRRSREHEEG